MWERDTGLLKSEPGDADTPLIRFLGKLLQLNVITGRLVKLEFQLDGHGIERAQDLAALGAGLSGMTYEDRDWDSERIELQRRIASYISTVCTLLLVDLSSS